MNLSLSKLQVSPPKDYSVEAMSNEIRSLKLKIRQLDFNTNLELYQDAQKRIFDLCLETQSLIE